MKKILLLTFLLIFAANGLCLAAKSSSRPVSRPSAPSTTTTAPASGYKPSAPASSYSEKAPAVKPPAAPQSAQQSTGGGWMRNAGMFAGGMLLGGMLSNMMGFGNSGFFAEMMGMILSILPILAVFLLGRYLWNRYRAGKEKTSSTRY